LPRISIKKKFVLKIPSNPKGILRPKEIMKCVTLWGNKICRKHRRSSERTETDGEAKGEGIGVDTCPGLQSISRDMSESALCCKYGRQGRGRSQICRR
jgi:hypothetical protein